MKTIVSCALAALALSALGSSAQAQWSWLGATAPAQAPSPAPAANLTTAPAVDCSTDNTDCGHWHAYTEFGGYILAPHWKTDPAFSVFSESIPVPNEVLTTHTSDFSDSAQFAPRISLGVAGPNNIGVRVGWWGFATGGSASYQVPTTGIIDQAITSATPQGSFVLAEGPGSTIAAESRLRMDVWDLEATKSWEGSSGMLLLSAGLSYAHISQAYDATTVSTEEEEFSGSLTSSHTFNGIGPTVALEGRLNLGRGFFLYLLPRGSFLYGPTQQTAFSTSPFFIIEGVSQLNGFSSSHDVISEIELELGAGWQRTFGRLQAFAQVGIVGMEWFEVGNSSRSSTSSLFFDEGLGNGGTTDNNLTLFGLSVNFGVRF